MHIWNTVIYHIAGLAFNKQLRKHRFLDIKTYLRGSRLQPQQDKTTILILKVFLPETCFCLAEIHWNGPYVVFRMFRVSRCVTVLQRRRWWNRLMIWECRDSWQNSREKNSCSEPINCATNHRRMLSAVSLHYTIFDIRYDAMRQYCDKI